MTADPRRPDAHRAPLQKHLRTTSRKFIIALLAGLLLALPPLPAAPREDTAPALSVGKVVGSPQAVRGGAGEIILRGIAMPGDSVEFKIQKTPAHGSLQGPRRIDRETVAYTYLHNGEKDHSSDRVLFKLKTGAGKSWGTLQAEIAIEEPSPRMELENPELDFGAVPIGASRTLPLVLRNSGGGALEGTIEVAAPWMLDGPPTFQLAESGTLPLKITFNPDGPGLRKGRLSVSSGTLQQSAILIGEGTYRFEAPSEAAFDPQSTDKFLALPVVNRTAKPLLITISAPPLLVVPASATIPPGGAIRLPVTLAPGHYTEKFATLSLGDSTATFGVKISLPPPPPLLEWQVDGATDLGAVAPGRSTRLTAHLANRGIVPAKVALSPAGEGLSLQEGALEPRLLQPGETFNCTGYWIFPESPGPATASITANAEGSPALRVSWSAQVVPEAEQATTRPQESKTPSDNERTASGLPKGIVPRRKPVFSDPSWTLRPTWPSASAVIFWRYHGPQPVEFTIERPVFRRAGLGDGFERRVTLPDELPEDRSGVNWEPVPASESHISLQADGRWSGTVSGLREGYNAIRVTARTPQSTVGEGFEIAIPVGKIPLPEYWKLLAAAIVILCSAYLLRRRIRGLFSGSGNPE